MHPIASALFALTGVATTGLARVGRPEACQVTADSSRRMELADGRIVSVDVQSTAVSGGSIMALGRHVYVFPRASEPMTSPVMRDSIIGFVMDRQGRVTIVPAPLRNRHVYFPMTAPAEGGAFHVLFVTGADSIDWRGEPVDTATIWYARYQSGRWSGVERVASVRDALLQPEFASSLLERNGSLTFLFAVAGSSNGKAGITRLRFRAGRWSLDTLRTAQQPTMLRADYDAKGTLIVLFAMQPPLTSEAEQLYVSRFDSSWSQPSRVGGSSKRPVSDLALAPFEGGVFAGWGQWRWPDASTNELFGRWIDDRSANTLDSARVDSGENTFPFTMIIASGRPAWFHIGSPYGEVMRLTIAESSSDVVHHDLKIPLHNPKPRPVALSSQRLIVFTMKRGRTSGESMIASYATGLTIRCPTSERR